MLAQNFMTAEALAISDEIHGALIKVLGMLDRNELKHLERERSLSGFIGEGTHFNMALTGLVTPCGTVACIGGWVNILAGVPIDDRYSMMSRVAHNPALFDLYFPTPSGLNLMGDITPSQAAMALRSYLTTGDARWSEALDPRSD